VSEPYIGEIRMFGGNFAPLGWAFCDGSLLAISENSALFSLLGTTYGGNGQTTFALPDLRGRIPIHFGQGAGLSPRVLGQSGGAVDVTLSSAQLPVHTHPLLAATGGVRSVAPAGAFPAAGEADLYTGAAANAQQPGLLGAGGAQPHPNQQPYLCVSFIIALFGIFPPRN
jgi:microcystin-dependent protein